MDCNTIYMYMLLTLDTVVHMVKNQFEIFFIRLFEPIQPLRIYKILKISDAHETTDLTNVYFKGDLKLDINPDERIEYRYMWMNRKSRMISNKESCPNIIGMTTKKPITVFIIKAILLNEDENVCENVLERVLKYAGPHHDFYNETIKMEWLFENDDLETFRSFLFIMYSNGSKQCVRRGEYIKNKIL